MKTQTAAIWGALATLALTGLVLGAVRSPAHSEDTAKSAEAVTYTRDIAPILYQNCDSCHRAGQIAPFALTGYADAQKRARLMAAVTESRAMPPWKAEPNFGHFTGERRLSDAQIKAISEWAAQGAPEGAPNDLPAMPKFPEGWALGPPDAVLQPSEAYTVAADGNDIYRCFVLPTSYTQDRWLSGMEVHPGNRKIVHHIIAYLDTTGAARKRDEADPGPGYTSFGGPGFTPSGALGGWVPGNDPALLPDGVGIFLPKGADIVLQVHYHKDGKPETDLTQLALYFSKAPVDKRVRTLPIMDPFLSIPAGDAHYAASASTTLPADITVRDIMPHMHLLGHDMTITAALPDGTTEPMVKVTDWDFNWQTKYTYAQPLKLPKGTKISLVAHYDNTANNPRNPNTPPKLVTWGEQTTDEMCFGFVGYTVDSEHLTQGVAANVAPEFAQATRDAIVSDLLTQFDKDNDGTLDAAELASLISYMQQKNSLKNSAGGGQAGSLLQSADPKQAAAFLLGLCDKNGDGKLDKAELLSVSRLMRGRNRGAGGTAPGGL